MKDWTIRVSYRWATQATFNMLCGIRMRILILEMLNELPIERQEHWKGLVRGVDAHVRSLYYGPKVDNSKQPHKIAAHRGHT